MQMNRESPKGLVTELRGRNGVTEMKVKHFLSGATLLSAALLLNAPLSAVVESDVVGYTTITMEAGKWYQIGCPFVALDGTEAPKINDVLGSGFESGDELMILNSETSRYSASAYWVAEKNAWCNRPIAAIATPIETVLPIGQAVYIHKGPTSSEVVFSGKVEAKEIAFGAENTPSWAQVAPVWPVSQSINDFEWKGLADGDELMILDSQTQTYTPSAYWISEKNAWCNRPIAAIATPVTTELKAGTAAYINKRQAGKATVSVK